LYYKVEGCFWLVPGNRGGNPVVIEFVRPVIAARSHSRKLDCAPEFLFMASSVRKKPVFYSLETEAIEALTQAFVNVIVSMRPPDAQCAAQINSRASARPV
jgi:hypothetical protein